MVRVRLEGGHEVLAQLRSLQQQLEQNVDEAVEVRALKMINDTRTSAPVKTGKLRNSVNIISQDTKPMSRTYGTNVEYAQIQEYEHRTKRGFFRNNITKHKPLLVKDVKQAVDKTFKG